MNNIDNRMILSTNLKRLMSKKGIDRREFCTRLGFKYTTVSEWLAGNKYPRIDKIEKMAQYFGVNKSELIEPHLKEIPKVPPNATPIDDLVSELFADRPDILALLTNGVYDDEGIYAGKKLADLSEPAKEHLKDTILTILKLSGYVKT